MEFYCDLLGGKREGGRTREGEEIIEYLCVAKNCGSFYWPGVEVEGVGERRVRGKGLMVKICEDED